MGTPPVPVMVSKPTAIPKPWMILNTTVPYLVYWVFFFRPAFSSNYTASSEIYTLSIHDAILIFITNNIITY